MHDKYNIIPSYLLSYETLSDGAFISFLKDHLKIGSCEVGMHPHIWTVPPYDKEKKTAVNRFEPNVSYHCPGIILLLQVNYNHHI